VRCLPLQDVRKGVTVRKGMTVRKGVTVRKAVTMRKFSRMLRNTHPGSMGFLPEALGQKKKKRNLQGVLGVLGNPWRDDLGSKPTPSTILISFVAFHLHTFWVHRSSS